jgi:folate-binding protein YgfZ
MMYQFHAAQGAKVADDGIPTTYSDLLTEYRAAQTAAVLLDRSHEGRIRVTGSHRADLLNRISTNELLKLAPGEGRPTIFTTSNARIIDRALVYNYPADALTLIAGPGRGQALQQYLQRNIFFRDDVKLESLNPTTNQFNLHGPNTDAIAEVLHPGATQLPPLHGVEATIAGAAVWLARDKAFIGTHWLVIVPSNHAEAVWTAILAAGQPHGLIPAGSLTFNTLRIQAGRPGVGRELSEDFIPLELGLWDEVNFQKGCYTGQEIIARMESRNRLAKTIVRLKLNAAINVPADLLHEGKRAGTLTSSVTAPDGSIFAIGVVKPSLAAPGQTLQTASAQATIVDLPGVQPPGLNDSAD